MLRYLRLTPLLLLLLLAAPVAVLAQGTGTSFPTPNGQIAPGSALLVPTGPQTNGQPVMGPPTLVNPLPTTCVNCISATGVIPAASNPTSLTVSVTNTFQQLLAANSARKGCVFQNQSTHTEYFSISVSPTLVNSLQVLPGAYFMCGNSNVVITDAIQVTGTAGDTIVGQWQ